MRSANRLLRLTIAVTLSLALAVPEAVAAAPQTSPSVIMSEGFEATSSPTYPSIRAHVDASHPGTWYWGRWTTRKRTGSYGLWGAGSVPSLTTYSRGTAGNALFDLSALSEYFSSNLSFHYTLPSRGTGDANSFAVRWSTQETSTNPQAYSTFPLTAVGAWAQKSYDLTAGDKVSLARAAGTLDFLFIDFNEYTSPATGEGPTIDDVLVTGWKYGPVRSLTATLSGSSVRLDWLRPVRAAGSVLPEERELAFRVWRTPVGSSDWTEMTTSPLGNSALSFTSPVVGEGVQYRYLVQAWNPAGTAYGQPAEVTVSAPVTPPTVNISTPAPGFVVGDLPITVSGAASDVGVGVNLVQLRIRRADGFYWNGLAWTATETWINASTGDGWTSWSHTWHPDTAATLQPVTITARARDSAGNLSATRQVTSLVPATPTISIADGASYVSSAVVTVSVDAPGASYVRSSIDSGPVSSFTAYSEITTASLPAVDGPHTIRMGFSADGASIYATASATVVLDTTDPEIGIVSPASGFLLSAGEQLVAGTATDTASGIESVRVRISRSGKYWNGFGWQEAEHSLPASGTTDWTLAWSPTVVSMAGYDPVTIEAWGVNGAGSRSATVALTSDDPKEPTAIASTGFTGTLSRYGQSVSFAGTLAASDSGVLAYKPVRMRYYDYQLRKWTAVNGVTSSTGYVKFTRIPANKSVFVIEFLGDSQLLPSSGKAYVVTPRVSVGNVSAPWLMYKTRYYTVSGYLRPRHRAGTYPIRIYRERYVSGRWYRYGTWVNARAYDAYSYPATDYRSVSKYVAKIRLPYAGKWRLRAYHPADTGHPAAWSGSYKYVTVR